MIRAERNLGFFICENFFVEAHKLLGLNKKLLLSRRIKYKQNKKAPNVFLNIGELMSQLTNNLSKSNLSIFNGINNCKGEKVVAHISNNLATILEALFNSNRYTRYCSTCLL